MTAFSCNDPACCGGSLNEAVLKELGAFSRSWRWGRLIDPAPDEVLDRRGVERRIIARARSDDAFLEELREHPRWVYMVAAENAFGVPKTAFLRRVREVRVLEESPEVLYLVLPPSAERAADSPFHEWLRERDGPRAPEPDAHGAGAEGAGTGRDERERTEIHLTERAAREQSFRQALLFRPDATYREAVRALHGGASPPYLDGVREIRVLPETPSSLGLVLPAGRPARSAERGGVAVVAAE
jgi:hypothetical protein